MRKLLCRKCGEHWTQLPVEDTGRGLVLRRRFVQLTNVPKDHGIHVEGIGRNPVFEKLDDIICDGCSEKITGDIAVAVTVYHEERPIREWEHEYGTVLPEEAVIVRDKLLSDPQKPK